jgi:hypothetical protein
VKLGISRLVETSKLLNTKSGKELSDLITHYTELAEGVIRALNNGLTLEDNMNGKALAVSLKSGVEQVINTDGKVPAEVRIRRVASSVHGVDSFLWYINNSGFTVIKANFTGSPTDALNVTIAILFS